MELPRRIPFDLNKMSVYEEGMELAALRESMRKLAPAPDPKWDLNGAQKGGGLSTGWAALDRLLSTGGLPRGALTELAGPSSSGKTALALGVLATQTQAGALAAFVDARGDLYPPAAAALGVDLSRLLIVRAGGGAPAKAARAAEILLQSRAFSVVALALPGDGELVRAPARMLRAAARRSSACVVTLTGRRGLAEGCAASVELKPRRSDRRGRRAIALVSKGSMSGGSARAEISFNALRIDHAPPAPLPEATKRASPGALPVCERGPA